MKLSRSDMLKLGVDQMEKGRNLSQIEADFSKTGASKKEIDSVLSEVSEYKKKRSSEAKRDMEKISKSQNAAAAHPKAVAPQAATPKKSSLWVFILFLLILIGILAYLYYTGMLNALDLSFLKF